MLPGPGRVFSERFGGAPRPAAAVPETPPPDQGTVTVVLGAKLFGLY